MGMKKQTSDHWQHKFASLRRWIKNFTSGLTDDAGGLLALRLAGAAVIGIIFIDAVVPEMYDRYAAQGVVVSGLTMTAYGIFGPWDF